MPSEATPLVGAAPAIGELRAQIQRLAAFDTPRNPNVPTVLLQGETGTGKGLVAMALHRSGGRARGPFIDVNCAAIPETMLEAELFGFEAGAFTDAKRAKPGLFEAAAGGTLFLDEVDALPVALQGKLLKAIEEKRVRRLGAVAEQRVDVKLVAATQRNLLDMVAAASFRADLYHRLAVVVLDLPSLRERREDIILLAEHFLAEHGAAHGLDAKHLDDSARAWLLAHPWPGNVRELSHLMERVTLLCPGAAIDRAILERLRIPLPPVTGDAAPAPARPRSSAAAPSPAGADAAADDNEAARIREALARSGGNVVRAAQLMGLGRNALRHRMKRHGIERPTIDALLAPGPAPVRPPRTAPGEPSPAEPLRAMPPAEPRWEQKPVAVLAIDLVIPESAPEPWTVAQRWTQRIEDHVAGFGGVFLSRTPSRFSAAFGVPRALEQLPQRAVQAGLAIRRSLTGADPRPELRMAVHVGTVRIDANAADPLTSVLPLGDTLAAPDRLLGHADAGEMLLSATAARRVESACELHARELRIGERATLPAFAVTGQRPRTAPESTVRPTRFVGRERELAELRASFESAAAGHGVVAFVVGEAGLGKSRLLAELREALASETHLWIEGRCASYGTTTAFLPIIDGLRRFFTIEDDDDETSAGAKIESGIGALSPDLAWVTPYIRQVLGLAPADATIATLDSASRRSEMFRALKAITLAAAERTPVVAVIEDLHWIDPASEEYLGFIAAAVPAMRVLLVGTHRPGYRHPFGDHSYHVRVTLRALRADDMATIAGGVLGTPEIPADVRALIAAKAEGNPFFVEEVTRSLVEDGALRRENGHVVLARALTEIVVPDTIQDVLSARLDRLADESRRAIQVASVIGREFALRLLERITGAGADVKTQVDELRTLELIYEKAADPELAYMFKHALTHDVAYESVLVERRRQLHRTIGCAIEELYADRLAEFYETLAHHFGRAEEWERALDYHERAAAKAAETFANRSVIAHCREALAIADRLGDRVGDERRCHLEAQLGVASFYVSEFATSGAAFERAAARTMPAMVRANCLSGAAGSYFWGHAYDAAARVGEALYDLARRESLPFVEALAMSAEGFRCGVLNGDVEAEERLLHDALTIAEKSGDQVSIAMIHFYFAQTAEWLGDYRRSIAHSESCIATGRRLRLPHLVIWPGWFLGKAHCCLGDYSRAIAQLGEAADVCDRIGDRAWKSRLLNTLGWCFGEIESHDRAREYNTRAAAIAHDIGDPEIVSNSEINLAVNNLALGDVDRARAYVEPILDALSRPGDPWMRWRYALHAYDVLGRLALARREPDEALALADRQIEGARRHRVRKVEARALTLAAEAYIVREQWQEADAALDAGIRIAAEIDAPRAAWRALALRAEAARRAGRPADAEQWAARHAALVATAARSIDAADLRRTFEAAARV